MLTWADLRSQILELGFEEESEYTGNPKRFITAANRALMVVCATVRPIVRKHTIVQDAWKNVLTDKFETEKHTDFDIEYHARGRAYWFSTLGTGSCMITDEIEAKTIDFAGAQEHRGFITGETTFRFYGDYAFYIENMAVYENTMSANAEEIPPWREYISYDIRELTKDEDGAYTFDGFALDLPVKSDGGYEYVRDYRIEQGRKIVLPREQTGRFEVWYKAHPKKITEATKDDAIIETAPEMEPLLHLLAAHYVWLDDDQTKATIYYNEYDDLKNVILAGAAGASQAFPSEIKNTRGWL